MLIYGYLITFMSSLHTLTLECQAIYLLEVFSSWDCLVGVWMGFMHVQPCQICALPYLPELTFLYVH